jgi:hypothetical protein
MQALHLENFIEKQRKVISRRQKIKETIME